MISFFSLLFNLIQYYLSIFQASKKFWIVSYYNIIYAFLALFLKIGLTYFFGLYGLLTSMLIINSLILIYFLRKDKMSFLFKWKELFTLIKFGFPLIILQFVTRSIFSIDKLVIAKFFTFEELGFYTIAIMAHSFLYSAPGKFVTVISPFFFEKVGKDKSHMKSLNYLIKTTSILAFFFAFLIGIFIIIYPLLVNFILPRFSPGINAAKIIIFATFFLGIVGMSTNVILALEKQKIWLLISVIVLITSIVLNFIFIKLGLGIEGVAFASLISLLIYTSSIIIYVLRLFEKSTNYIFKFLTYCYFPIIYTFICIKILSFVTNNFTNSFNQADIAGFISTSTITLAFFILYLPLFYLINKKTNIISLIINLLKKKLIRI